MSSPVKPIKRPAGGFTDAEVPPSKTPRVASASASAAADADLDPALVAYEPERLQKIIDAFAKADRYKYERNLPDRVEWKLVDGRLKLMVKETPDRPAKVVTGFMPFTVFFNPEDSIDTPADGPCKWRIVSTVPLEDVAAARVSSEAYAAASDEVAWHVDMTIIYHEMLLAALKGDGVVKQLAGTKVAEKLFTKKKPLAEAFDADLNRLQGDRPARFSLPVTHSGDKSTVAYTLYITTNPSSATTQVGGETSEDVMAALADEPASVLSRWCETHPGRTFKTDVFSTLSGSLTASTIAKRMLIRSPKAQFVKGLGRLMTGGHSYSFAAKPNMFTSSVFPTDRGICFHLHSPPGGRSAPSLSDADKALYATGQSEADFYSM